MSSYECALTSLESQAGVDDDSDGLDDLPVGWTKITIQRRGYNPKWLFIQQVKEQMIAGLLQQFPPEVQEGQELAIRIQVEAQMHSLESDTPMYERDMDDVVYLSDSGQIVETFNEIRALLGLEELTEDEDDDGEEIEDIQAEATAPKAPVEDEEEPAQP